MKKQQLSKEKGKVTVAVQGNFPPVVLSPNDWAIIWSQQEGWRLKSAHVPNGVHVPEEALSLTACMLRLEIDSEFRKECEEWFKKNSRS